MASGAHNSNPAPAADLFADPLAASVIPAIGIIEAVLLTNNDGPLTKSYEVVGTEVVKGEDQTMASGTADRIVFDADRFHEVFPRWLALRPEQALALGSLTEPGDKQNIVVDDLVDEEREYAKQGAVVISRSKRFIAYRKGKPGPVLLDIDLKGAPDHVKARLRRDGSAIPLLTEVMPELARCALVARGSTSTAVRWADGRPISDGLGEHIYIILADASDARRFLRVLLDRLWLAGPGWSWVSEFPAVLLRGLVDALVGEGSRIVYEGDPVVGQGLMLVERPVRSQAGGMLDSRLAMPDLTDDEEARLAELREAERVRLQPEIDAKRVAYRQNAVDKLVATGVDRETAEHRVDELLAVDYNAKVIELRAPLLIDFDRFGVIGDGEWYRNRWKYHRETVRDPLEPEYGRGKAQFYAAAKDGSGYPFINSFAHGGRKFRLIPTACDEFEEVALDDLKLLVDAAVGDGATVEVLLGEAALLDRVAGMPAAQPLLDRLYAALGDDETAKLKTALAEWRKKQEEASKAARERGEVVEIRISVDPTPDFLDRVAKAMSAGAPIVYEWNGRLARIGHRETVEDSAGLRHAAGSIFVRPLSRDDLRAQVAGRVDFVGTNTKGEKVRKPIPTSHLGALLEGSIGARRFPPLAGVARLPRMLDNGSLSISRGYDRATGLWYDGSCPPLAIPDHPTDADVKTAKELLLEPFAEFTFADARNAQAAIVTLIFTLIHRPYIPISMMFVAGAPMPGSGKGLLVSTAHCTVLGHDAAIVPPPGGKDPNEELAKRLDALLMSGATAVHFDNFAGMIKSDALSSVLTSPSVNIRPFGSNTAMVDAVNKLAVAMSGNGLAFRQDISRRIYGVTIDPGCEHPEQREFKRPGSDLTRWVLASRAERLSAAYTIDRAFRQAGSPVPGGMPVEPSFTEWFRRCVAPVIWLDIGDPLASRDAYKADDPDRAAATVVFQAAFNRFGERFTARELELTKYPVDTATPDQNVEAQTIADAFDALGLKDARALGRWLQSKQGAVFGGVRIDPGGLLHNNVRAYRAQRV